MDPRQVYENGILYHHYANTAYPLTPSSFSAFRVGDPGELPGFLARELAKVDELSLYVHVPFCKVRCKFCEYAVLEGVGEEAEDEYVGLLRKEIAMYAPLLRGKRIVGFDLGGGTPTKLSVANLKAISEAVVSSFEIQDGVTFSIETTPVIAAREPEKIAAVYAMGYRRISMGIQTVSEKLLNDLGREGTASVYEEAARNIRAAGFRKFNVDLMYGFLHQSDDDFENTLRYAVSLEPEYITLYRNRYKGTQLEGESGGVSLYRIIRQYRLAFRFLRERGYEANPGKNTFSKVVGDYGTSDYLTRRVIEGVPYLGLGIGAQSFGMDYLAYNQGAASKRIEGYRERIESGRFPIQDAYRLPLEESIAKMVSVAFYFGFVDLDAFMKRFGVSFLERFREEVDFVLEKGLMEMRGRRIALTERGADYINGVIPLFFSPRSKEELLALIAKAPEPSGGEREFLKAYTMEDFDRPSLAVDIVVLAVDGEPANFPTLPGTMPCSVVLIKRGEHPWMNEWALPGGFVKPGESVEETALRELKEEAGIGGLPLSQLRVFSEPRRDPRGWIVSCAFAAIADRSAISLRFGDDALDAQLFSVAFTESAIQKRGSGGSNKAPQDAVKYELKLANADRTLISTLARWETPSGPNFQVIENGGISFDHAEILAHALEGFYRKRAGRFA